MTLKRTLYNKGEVRNYDRLIFPCVKTVTGTGGSFRHFCCFSYNVEDHSLFYFDSFIKSHTQDRARREVEIFTSFIRHLYPNRNGNRIIFSTFFLFYYYGIYISG